MNARERFEAGGGIPAPDPRGIDPAEYDLSPRQRREVRAKLEAGAKLKPIDLRRRETNNRAGKDRERELSARKRKRAEHDADALRHKPLAANPLGPTEPDRLYWETRDGGVFSEPKPRQKITLTLCDEDTGAIAAALSETRRGERFESVAAYLEHLIAGHARGLRNARVLREAKRSQTSGAAKRRAVGPVG